MVIGARPMHGADLEAIREFAPCCSNGQNDPLRSSEASA